MLNRVHIRQANNIGVTAKLDSGRFITTGPRGGLRGTPAEREAELARRLSMGRTILDGSTQEDRDILDCFRNQPVIHRHRVRKGWPSSQ